MPIDLARLEGIFSEALTKSAPAERAVFLDQSCKDDLELRQRLDRLLAAHESARNFMPPLNYSAAMESASRIQERTGTRIGPYMLLEQIGEGGFGVVFMAEQEHPVRRRVALKIVKLGMDTRQVVARFEAERQALAMMDHPNIAKVLEAGATDTGRPYFVMELVKGIPITQYCDEYRLSPRARLELFEHVCHAVQHAHQKGIIHRDIKPTNVLISRHDDKPVVKVIDFGIAKATGTRLSEKSVLTEMRQMIGTPVYMSPEQAGKSDLDIDTRSDIYSLGVLLYELLTGTTPFDAHELLHASYGEIQRLIQEVDPPRPSTRLSSLKDTLAGIAANRQIEPARLSRLIRGDLDWIVMRCLEKDRRRRYETACSLSADIQRYLNDVPVEASPPSATYQLIKFARRHRFGVITGAVTAAALLLGIFGTARGMLWAIHERNRAIVAESQQRQERIRADAARRVAQKAAKQSEQVLQFLQAMLGSIDPEDARTSDVTVREVLDQAVGRVETSFVDQPRIRIALNETIGQTYIGLRLFEPAKQCLERAVALRRRYLTTDPLGLANILYQLAVLPTGNSKESEVALSRCKEARAILCNKLSPDDSRIAIVRAFEAHLSYAATPEKPPKTDVWSATILPVLPLLGENQLAQMSTDWADTIKRACKLQQSGLSGQALALLHQWRIDSLTRIREMCAIGQFEAAAQFARKQYAPMLDVPILRPIVPMGMMSVVQSLKDEHEDPRVIEVFLGEVLYSSRIVSGEESSNSAWAMCERAKLLLNDNTRLADAEAPAREALRIRRKVLGNEHPLTEESVSILAEALEANGDFSAAEALRREMLDPTRQRTPSLPSHLPLKQNLPASTQP